MSEKKMSRMMARGEAETDMRTAIKVRTFTFYSDEPVSQGGTDEAANPVELLLGALCGCINVVGHAAAKILGIEIKSLKVTVRGELDPEGMFKDPDVSPRLQHVDVEVDADMDVEPEMKQKWLDMIEPNCPIAETLVKGTELNVHLK